MALSLQDGNLVWQKVKIALMNAHPAVQAQFKGLKEYLAQQVGNPQLQFVPFSEAQCDDADGTGVVDAACKIYAVYVKKVSAATDNYFKIYDSATVDTTAGEQIIAIPLLGTEEVATQMHPLGLAMAAGVTVTQHTTSIGVTDGSDGGDGFVLIGAA